MREGPPHVDLDTCDRITKPLADHQPHGARNARTPCTHQASPLRNPDAALCTHRGSRQLHQGNVHSSHSQEVSQAVVHTPDGYRAPALGSPRP